MIEIAIALNHELVFVSKAGSLLVNFLGEIQPTSQIMDHFSLDNRVIAVLPEQRSRAELCYANNCQ